MENQKLEGKPLQPKMLVSALRKTKTLMKISKSLYKQIKGDSSSPIVIGNRREANSNARTQLDANSPSESLSRGAPSSESSLLSSPSSNTLSETSAIHSSASSTNSDDGSLSENPSHERWFTFSDGDIKTTISQLIADNEALAEVVSQLNKVQKELGETLGEVLRYVDTPATTAENTDSFEFFRTKHRLKVLQQQQEQLLLKQINLIRTLPALLMQINFEDSELAEPRTSSDHSSPTNTPPAPALRKDSTQSETTDVYEQMVKSWEIEPSALQLNESALLGRGKYGSVYLAKFHGLDVAVKVFEMQGKRNFTEQQLQDFMDSFRRECAVMRKLVHPNVLLMLGAVTVDPTRPMLVTEYMPCSLADLIHKRDKQQVLKRLYGLERIPLAVKIRIMHDVARAMSWLHGNRPVFIHADLKPANLLLDRNLSVKVADFGLTQMKEHIDNEVAGTPAYAAPELLLRLPYDEKVDVFSYAVCCWELFTEKRPYSDEGPKQVLALSHHVCKGGRPTIPSDCPPLLRDMIRSCWDTDPKKRPSFDELIKSNIFQRMLLDAVFSTANTGGKRLWTYFISGAGKENASYVDRVPWTVFEGAFLRAAGLNVRAAATRAGGNNGSNTTDQNFAAFYLSGTPLQVLKSLLVDRTTDTVSLERWANCLEWFGPMPNPRSGKDLLERLATLAAHDWFHGDISKWFSAAVLKTQPKGTFLVRMVKPPGCFELVAHVEKEDEIVRYKLYHRAGEKFVMIPSTTGDPVTNKRKVTEVLQGVASASLESGPVRKSSVKSESENYIEADDLPTLVKKLKQLFKLKKACSGSQYQQLSSALLSDAQYAFLRSVSG